MDYDTVKSIIQTNDHRLFDGAGVKDLIRLRPREKYRNGEDKVTYIPICLGRSFIYYEDCRVMCDRLVNGKRTGMEAIDIEYLEEVEYEDA